MKKLFGLFVVLVLAAGLAVSCGGKEKKKGPVYPACKTDVDCADKGEFCFNGTCSECAKKKHCDAKGPCLKCNGGKCVGKPNCCSSKADCPTGEKCVVKPGKKDGTCKTL